MKHTLRSVRPQSRQPSAPEPVSRETKAVLDREWADYLDEPTAEDAEGAGQAKAVPGSRRDSRTRIWRDNPLVPLLADLAGRVRELYTKLTTASAGSPVALGR